MDFFLNKAKSWRPSRHTHTKQTEIDKQQMVACFGSQFLRIISLAIIFTNFQKFLSKKTLIWELWTIQLQNCRPPISKEICIRKHAIFRTKRNLHFNWMWVASFIIKSQISAHRYNERHETFLNLLVGVNWNQPTEFIFKVTPSMA